MFEITFDPITGSIGIKPTFGLSDATDLFGRVFAQRDSYIDYSVDHASKFYGAGQAQWVHERRAQGGNLPLPYEMLFDYRKVDTKVLGWGKVCVRGKFQFPADLSSHRQTMIDRMTKEGRIKGSSSIPRLSAVEVREGVPFLTIDAAEYYDQVGTNLTIDFPFKAAISIAGTNCATVREWDVAQGGQGGAQTRQLPSLETSRLANSIGVGVGISACDDQGRKHFVYRFRTPKAPVYPNTWHLPVSFALEMDFSKTTGEVFDLEAVVQADFAEELAHEAQIFRREFHAPKPVAWCRDLCRGGKPQLFLELESKLPLDELLSRIGRTSAEYRKAPHSLADGKATDISMSPELACFLALATNIERA